MNDLLFKKLLPHFGHKLECVTYGPPEKPDNVAIECTDCCEVLIDASSEGEDHA